MVLAVLAFGLSLGIWYQSLLFVVWVLILFAPALLAVVKVFEERELEVLNSMRKCNDTAIAFSGCIVM
jgi:hypothetical protein